MSRGEIGIKDVPSRSRAYIDKRGLLREVRLLPNILSLFRVTLLFPIAVLYNKPDPASYWTVVILLSVSYLSDYFDGFFARRLNLVSRLGHILDPVADKLWTLVMVFLVCRYRGLEWWVGGVVVLRDVVILVLNYRCFKRNGFVMTSDEVGRKYLVALGLMMIGFTIRFQGMHWFAYGMVVFAVVTATRYYQRFRVLSRPKPAVVSAAGNSTDRVH